MCSCKRSHKVRDCTQTCQIVNMKRASFEIPSVAFRVIKRLFWPALSDLYATCPGCYLWLVSTRNMWHMAYILNAAFSSPLSSGIWIPHHTRIQQLHNLQLIYAGMHHDSHIWQATIFNSGGIKLFSRANHWVLIALAKSYISDRTDFIDRPL